MNFQAKITKKVESNIKDLFFKKHFRILLKMIKREMGENISRKMQNYMERVIVKEIA